MKLFAERLRSKIPVFSLIISVIVAWMIAPTGTGFPMVAFFIFFTGLSSLVYFVRNEKTWFDTMLYIGILLLSFFTIYRANENLQFLDFMFIFFFGSILIRPLMKEYGVFSIILSPLIVIKNAFTATNIFPYKFKMPEKYAKMNYIREYVPTIAVTAFILLITIPLLASANLFFNALLQNVLNFFNLNWLFKLLFADSLMAYILRFVALATLLYFIPRLLTVSVRGTENYTTKPWFSINYLIPKVAMAMLLIIFFITQIQLYFASPQTLQSMGYTNARLTNEVFAQVTLVAFIVFVLAYFDKSRKKWNTLLTYFLIIESCFLVGIAFKSVYDYSAIFGYTQKRLWGYTTMTWLTCALAAYTYHYRKQTPDLKFIKQIMTLTMGVLLIVNLANFDYIIYHYAKPSTVATNYGLFASLSPDARQYKEVLTKAMNKAEKAKFDSYDAKIIDPVYRITGKIEFLRSKYEKRKDINSFNFAEYQAYLDTKDIDVAAYRKKIRDTQQKEHQE